VITEYTFGFNYNQLGSDDFANTFHNIFLDAGLFCNLIPHFPWLGKVCKYWPFTARKATNIMKLMNSLPDDLVMAMNPSVEGFVNLQRV